jgi:phage baseplate assembly protein W
MENIFNINFPLQDSLKGYFLDLTPDQSNGFLADIKHLLLTTKGTRYFRPSFGGNLKKQLFEPNDEYTHRDIKGELQTLISSYFPNVTINSIEISTGGDVSELFNEDLVGRKTSTKPPSKDAVAKVRITLTIQRGAFQSTEIIELQF